MSYMAAMHVITSTRELAAACDKLATKAYVTVDTEFMRETTFWPILCLIQLAGEGEEHLVDPLAPGLELGPFFALMSDTSVVKVFHAARQDIEIIHHLGGIIPEPLFDTQLAAMVCGFGESVGYGTLVREIAGCNLDKSSRFTNWNKRPLTDKQLTYALGDVTHLRTIYSHLRDELAKTGRDHWLAEEMAQLTAPEIYQAHPEDAWKRLRLRVNSKKAMAILMELAAWREELAQREDVTRNRILRDEAIYDIANQAPRDPKQLAGLRTINGTFARSQRGEQVVAAVERGLARPPDSVPSIKRNSPPSQEVQATVELLKVLLKARSAEHHVAPKLIATSDDLEHIARSESADVNALKGWRRELFGEDALALKRGELGLAMAAGSVVTIDLGN